MNMLGDARVVAQSGAASAAQTDLDGAVIDMTAGQMYGAILLTAALGDVTATCVLELQLRGSDNADGSSSVLLATTGTYTAGASDADNKLMLLDVVHPQKRYVFGRLKRGTANAVVNSMTATLYAPGVGLFYGFFGSFQRLDGIQEVRGSNPLTSTCGRA
jgi:hypothetical protein